MPENDQLRPSRGVGETQRPSPQGVQVVQQINPMAARTESGMEQLATFMGAAEPGLAALWEDRRQKKRKQQMLTAAKDYLKAQAQAELEDVDLSRQEAREAFFQDKPRSYMESYMGLYYADAASSQMETIAKGYHENKHKPDFDADAWFDMQMSAAIEDLDDPEAAEKVLNVLTRGVAELQNEEFKRDLMGLDADYRTKFRGTTRRAAGEIKTPEGVETLLEVASRGNIPREEALPMVFASMAEQAVESGDASILEPFLREGEDGSALVDEAGMRERLQTAQAHAETRRKQIWTEKRNDLWTNYAAIATAGNFTQEHAAQARRVHSEWINELDIQRWLKQSQQGSEDQLDIANAGLLFDRGHLGFFGLSTLTKKQRDAILTDRKRAYLENNPEKGLQDYYRRLAANGGLVDSTLQSQLTSPALGGVSGVEGDQLTPGLDQSLKTFRALYEDPKLRSLAYTHITDDGALQFHLGVYHRMTLDPQLDAASAVQQVQVYQERISKMSPEQTRKFYEELDSKLKLLTDGRDQVYQAARVLAGTGIDPETAVEYAQEQFDATHFEFQGRHFPTGGAGKPPKDVLEAGFRNYVSESRGRIESFTGTSLDDLDLGDDLALIPDPTGQRSGLVAVADVRGDIPRVIPGLTIQMSDVMTRGEGQQVQDIIASRNAQFLRTQERELTRLMDMLTEEIYFGRVEGVSSGKGDVDAARAEARRIYRERLDALEKGQQSLREYTE